MISSVRLSIVQLSPRNVCYWHVACRLTSDTWRTARFLLNKLDTLADKMEAVRRDDAIKKSGNLN